MPQDRDGNKVTMKAAYDDWAPFAVALLIDTAKTYNNFITYKQLAEFVQDQTGITHNGLITNWIGELLGRVISYCLDQDIPQLSALCVTSEGSVGNGYREVLRVERMQHVDATGEEEVTDTMEELDDHAAKTRLKCYEFFGAELPPGGGKPTLTPQLKAAHEYKMAQQKRHEPPKLCPIHHQALSVTGNCFSCE